MRVGKAKPMHTHAVPLDKPAADRKRKRLARSADGASMSTVKSGKRSEPAQRPAETTEAPGLKHDPVLKRARRWCREARPIFICGPARSGTSILTVSFAKHSQLFTPRGVAETFAFATPKALRDTPVRKGVKKYLGDRETVQRFQALAASIADRQALSDKDLIRLFFFFAGTKVYPGLRPLEKTPSHVSCLDRIFDIFPQARVVVSLRDPVDIVSSYRKRLQQEQAAGADRSVWGWLEKSPERLASRFQAISRELTAVREADADKVFVAPYGWVTADPTAALHELMRFLDLPIEEGMADGRPSGRGEPLSDDEMDNKRLAEPISARASERHSYLTADEISLVEEATASLRDSWRQAGPLNRIRAEHGFFLPDAAP